MNSPQLLYPQIKDVVWGEGCSVFAPVNIYRCIIGDRVKIGPFVEIQNGCRVGDDTVIGSHSFIAADTLIGSRCFIGHGVMTCNDRWPEAGNKDWLCQPIIIGDDVSIGTGAVLLPGVRIGNRAKIGAGAIVTKDIMIDTIYHNNVTVVARRA